ncbi:MAG: thiol reductant ABC exporter subunit CydD [Xanthobacteraceae bacterium]
MTPERAQARWMMGLRRHGGGALTAAVLLPLAGGLALVAQAYVLAGLLHRAIAEGAAPGELAGPVAAFAGLLLARILLGLGGEWAGLAAAERIKLAVRAALFADLIGRRPDWSAARASGAVAAALVDQAETLDGFFARFLPAMIQASLLPLAFIAAVLPVDWVAGLLFLVTAPLIPLFMALIGFGAQAATTAQADALARLSALFADRLRGLSTLKLHDRAAIETAAVEAASEELRARTLGVLRIAFLSSAVLEFFAAIGVAGVALAIGLGYLGYIHLHAERLTLEAGLFCLLMAPEVYQPLRLLAAHYHDRAGAKAAVAEIARQFGALPEVPAPAVPATLRATASPAALGVEVIGLGVATPDGARRVLDKVSFTAEPGARIALLGESGIGKSTLIETLARLRAYEGEIRIDGRPLDAVPEPELRTRIALLGQRPRIFHGTVADNIRLGRPDASPAELRRAAARAGIAGLPDGLDTLVGEGGLGLSGGEAHRVALARIFLRDPGLILLDEPTAHLDRDTEHRVLDALLAFAQGRTLIIATHSAAVAARMERIYRIAGGALLPAPHKRTARDGTA